MAEFVRGPGYDWRVHYEFDNGEDEEMSVFGQLTVEEAIKEARYSLDGFKNLNVGRYVITGVERVG